MPKAVKYLRQAGSKAAARSANREAVSFFEQALVLLDESPQTPESLSETLDIRIALGPALIAVKGAPSTEVETSYLGAKALVDRLGDASRRFPVLWGLWFVNFTRGRYAAAIEAGEQLLETARKGDDTGLLLEAHHSLWPTLSAMGQVQAAGPHIERGLALYDRERHGGQAFVYGGHDPGACCRYHLAANRWVLGHPEGAIDALRDAFRLIEELKHPLTTVIALWFAAWLHYHRGDREAALADAERLASLCGAYGFRLWTDIAIILPHVTSEKSRSRKALDELRDRLEAAGSHTAWRRAFINATLAEMYGASGHAKEGLRLLASIDEASRGAFYAAEIARIEGELILKCDSPSAVEGEGSIRRAIDLARSRGEKAFELRAASSLARLWKNQRRHEEAHHLLSGVYSSFTEGFDTADLRSARELLKELA
jgi:adenylate cyclase